ncbi:DUF362 domain-containing protein [bacterium]|nr:MAG: DUF362 domain-containing protein [bacterium]
MSPSVAIVRCNNYDPAQVLAAMKRVMDLSGGISAFIRPQSKVLVKPNLLMAQPPEAGITTHPEVVRAVVQILKEIGCEVFIGDGPSVWGSKPENVDEVYDKTGIRALAQEEGVDLVKFTRHRWREKFPLTTWLDECDYLVSIPKFKTHCFTILTGAIKNLYGLVSGPSKTELHKKYITPADFAGIITDIYAVVRPALTIVDGIVAMEGDGPGTGGKLRNSGVLIAGNDCVAIDSILALIMGLKPNDILTIKEASGRNLGVSDIASIQIHGEKLAALIGKHFKLPTGSLSRIIPKAILEIIKRLIRSHPEINYNNCADCRICIEVCPQGIIKVKAGRPVIDYSGCTNCFCCLESCPNAAIKIKKSFLAKLLGL